MQPEPRFSLTEAYDRLVAAGDRRNDPAQRAVLARMEPFRIALERGGPGGGWLSRLRRDGAGPQGLYLWGGVGRGKSMMMDLLLAITAVPGRRRVHFDAFLRDIHAAVHRARQARQDDPLGRVTADFARGLRLLAFDEMQVQDIADAAIVGRIFADLFAAGVRIVTTSNRPPEDLYRDGLKRELFLPFIGLLRDRMEVIRIDSDTDHRLHRMAGAPVYFHPDDSAATAALDRIWTDLARGQARPVTLRVQGRDLVLPACHDGIARMTFAEACGTPRSPADYLAMADALRVLVLDHVPRLSEGRHDDARRFVTLVDAFYEAKGLLIIGAAVPPQALYPEGEGSFEFARLVSRLREMQGADWIGAAIRARQDPA
ncbi:MAG: AFG1 family ATPase [Paracoccaceae bacterium]|nr:MAG: AFG1 family ATPase [Paracoccaceae bacterium]